MNVPLVPFANAGNGATPSGEPEPLARLVENIARLIDRLHPPGIPDMPQALAGATGRLRRALANDHGAAANHAILALKEVLHEVESLRERSNYLDSASARAFAELNTTEHRLRELTTHIDRFWAALAQASTLPEAVREIAADSLADPEQRLEVLRTTLVGATEPSPASEDLASKARNLRSRAAALRKDHGRSNEDELRAKHQQDLNDLEARQAETIAALRVEHDNDRASLAEQLATTRRELAMAEAERDRLRSSEAKHQAEHETNAERDADIEQLRQELDEARNAAAVAATTATLASEAEVLRAEHVALQTRCENAEQALEDLQQAMTATQAELATLRDERDALQAGLADLEATSTAQATADDAHERDQQALADRLATAESATQSAKRAAQAAEHAVQAAQNTITKLEATAQSTQQERDRLAQELIATKAQIEDLEQELARDASAHHRAISERDALRDQVEQAQAQANDIEATAATQRMLTEQIDAIENERLAAARTHAEEREHLHHDLETLREQADRDHRALAEREQLAHERTTSLADLAHQVADACSAMSEAAANLPDAGSRHQQALTSAAAACRSAATTVSSTGDTAAVAPAGAQAGAALAALGALVSEVTSDHANANETIAVLRNDLDTTRSELAQALQRVTSLSADVEAARQTTAAAEQALQASEERLSQANALHSTDELARQALVAEVAASREELTAAQAEWETIHETLRAEITQLTNRAEEATQHSSQASTRLTALQYRLAQACSAEGDISPEAALDACLRLFDQQSQDLDEALANVKRDSDRHQLQIVELEQHIRDGESERTRLSEALEQATTAQRSNDLRNTDLQRELSDLAARLDQRDHDLLDLRSQLATQEADLAAARATSEELESRLATQAGWADDIAQLTAQVASVSAEREAAEEHARGLLDAVKTLGHVANEAADRVGVGLPAYSRNLTRTTARIERAEAGADHAVAMENARAVCQRAAEQCDALATALSKEREVRFATGEARDHAVKERDALQSRFVQTEARIAELEPLVEQLTTLQSERQDQAKTLAELSAEQEQLRDQAHREHREIHAEREDLAARLAVAQAEIVRLDKALRKASHDTAAAVEAAHTNLDDQLVELQATVAEAEGRAAGLSATIDEQNQALQRLQADLDAARAGKGEVLGYQARIRSLTSKLNETIDDNAKLRAERERDAERLAAVAAQQDALAHLERERDAAEQARRQSEATLREERAVIADLKRHIHRLEREAKRRLASLDMRLAESRERTENTAPIRTST